VSELDDFDFYEMVDLLRIRMFDAEAIDDVTIPTFRELMKDEVVPETFYHQAYDELEAIGHLGRASGKTGNRNAFGQLSAVGRAYVRALKAESGE
jgi:hypothetical protein